MSIKVVGMRLSQNDNVYTNRDGSKAVAACAATVELAEGVAIDATVYGRFKEGDAAVRFEATVPSKGISFSDTVKTALIEAAENAVSVWSGWEPASARAERLLTQPKGTVGKPGSKLAPRLVKPVDMPTVVADKPAGITSPKAVTAAK